jgi:tetratricopeptide (TPR) repeat protein
LFEDIDRLAPRGPWGAYGQAVVAAQRGDHAQAISFCERALERDPDHEPSIQLRAQLARLKGDTLGEERLLARYVALQPMDAEARVRLGELAQAAGRMEDARRQLMRAYELEPRPSTAAQLADLARLANDVDDERRWRQRSGAPLRNPDEEPVSQPLVQ